MRGLACSEHLDALLVYAHARPAEPPPKREIDSLQAKLHEIGGREGIAIGGAAIRLAEKG